MRDFLRHRDFIDCRISALRDFGVVRASLTRDEGVNAYANVQSDLCKLRSVGRRYSAFD